MEWLAAAADYLGGFPDDYLVIDAETLGKDPKDPKTVMIEFGYCMVEDRKVTQNGEFLLNWTDPKHGYDQALLRAQLENIEREIRQNGFQTRFVSYEELQSGSDVRTCLEEIYDIVACAKRDRLTIVGHNFWGSDAPVLQRHFWRDLGKPLRIQASEILDTGLLEKGRQMKIDVPDKGKSIEQWYDSIARRFSKVKWSLGKACRETYNIAVAPHEEELFHRGAFDCLFNSRLLEAMRVHV